MVRPCSSPSLGGRRPARAPAEKSLGLEATRAKRTLGDDALPHLAKHVDDMALLMAMFAPTSEHSAGQTMQTSGFVTQGFPTVGAWVSYALGSLNDNLPKYVALPDPIGLPWTGKAAWTNGFLPASHQGTMINPASANPVPDLFPPKGSAFANRDAERASLELMNKLNRRNQAAAPDDSRLEARIASYELAAHMQLAVPDLLDIGGETAATCAVRPRRRGH